MTTFEIWGMGTDAAYNSHLKNKSKYFFLLKNKK